MASGKNYYRSVIEPFFPHSHGKMTIRFIITIVKGMVKLQIDKKKQKHIVEIFYMWMFCITLKERNTKRYVQNWHSPSHLRQNGHDFA
jgi:hypothetical protein